MGKLPIPFYLGGTFHNPEGHMVSILQRLLASKGLESATEISSILKNESRPEARLAEADMLKFLDFAAVRLRASSGGRAAIETVRTALQTREFRFFNGLKVNSIEYWRSLEGQVFRDEVNCNWDSWATLIAVAMEQRYGDQLTHFLFPQTKVCSSTLFSPFITYLTTVDPAFPLWEFPSTVSEDDLFHPRFWAKIARYHDAYIEMQRRATNAKTQ